MNMLKMAQKANAKFAQYGERMSLIKVVRIDESGDWQPSESQTETVFMGLWDNVKADESNDLVHMGDAVIWAGGMAIPEPTTQDFIVCGGKAWQIIVVESIRPGNQAVIFKLYVREAGSADAYLQAQGGNA